jgi:hypothetical protein
MIHVSGTGVYRSYALTQNYPNPFNPSTYIRYQVRSEGWITIRVYDLPGRLVEDLVNENQRPGEYTVTWNAGNFPSGVYYCRMVAGNFISTKKMILVK